MKNMILTLLVALLFPALSLCFSMGAPDAACAQLTPGHAHPSQLDSPPTNLTVSRSWVRPGGLLQVELVGQTPETTFKGFIIQARDKSKPDVQVSLN